MSLSVDTVSAHPSFIASLALYSEKLSAVYTENQRLGANFGSHRRWLVSQSALALYWDQREGLTVQNLIKVLKPFKVASTNTIRDYIDESLTYGFLQPDRKHTSLRPRYFEPTALVYAAIGQWLGANLQILDTIDGGGRFDALSIKPELGYLIQPILAWRCLRDAAWREPPERIAILQKTISGGLVMDAIIIMVAHQPMVRGRFEIPAPNTRDMAKRILISRTHLQLIFRKIVSAGAIGWTGTPFESTMWVDVAFIDEYCRWQAVKAHHVDESYKAVFNEKLT